MSFPHQHHFRATLRTQEGTGPQSQHHAQAPWPDLGTPAPTGKGLLTPEAVATALLGALGGEAAGLRPAAGRVDGVVRESG